MKKLLLLFAAMLLPLMASAYDLSNNGIYYNLKVDGSLEVVGSSTTNVDIPSSITINGVKYRVTSIGMYAFNGRSDISYLSIPYSIKSIGEYAFSSCGSSITVNIADPESWCQMQLGNEHASPLSSAGKMLVHDIETTSFEVPSTVTSIGAFTFYQCSCLTSLYIPSSVTSIGSSAFEDCDYLASLTLNEGLQSIGGSAFEGCKRLTSITIPSTVNKILINAFKNCVNLTDVYCKAVNVPNTDASAFNGVFFENVTLHVPASAVNSYRSAWPWNNFKEIVSLDGGTPVPVPVPVSDLTENGIYYTLKSDGTLEVTGLASWVTRTDIPGSVSINGNQYRVTSIGNRAFEGRSDITYLSIPNSVTYIGWSAFQGCSGLTSITIPNSVTFINDIAFSGCSGLTSISIPNSVTSVGEDVFKDTGWEKYQSAGILYLDNWVLGYKGGKPVGELRIADGIKGIASASFSGCSGLTSLVIPNSMTFICNGAFYGCISLTTIVTKIENPFKIDRDVFSSETYTKAELIVPKGIKTAYQSTAGWNVFNKITEANDAFDLVDNGIYYNLKGDGTLEVAGLASWANRADIPSSLTFNGTRYRVTSIAARAFEGRSDLTYLSIPYSIMSIGEFAFSSCGSNITVNIADPESWCQMKLGNEHASPLSSAGKMLVHDIETTSFEVPSTVTSIGAFTFYQCSCLKSLYIPSSVTSIGSSAFEDCDYLASLTLNEGLQSIGGSAFEGCKRLTSITIPSTVNSILINAFKNCVSVTDVYCKAVNVPNTDASAFNGVFFENITLHVPASAVGTYGSKWPWNNFKEIVPIDTDAIVGVKLSDDRHAEYYDLTGRKVHQPQKGLYIKNGKKTIVK